jgi:multidrug efflux pump subunit AcrB
MLRASSSTGPFLPSLLSIFIVLAVRPRCACCRSRNARRSLAGRACARSTRRVRHDSLEQTVAAPIENAINGVEHMLYMSSNSSSNGVVQIQVTFDIGTDADQAALNVNNRVKQAEARLPEEVRRQGVTVEKGSSAFLQVLAFYSPDDRFDDLYTSNYVTLNVLDELKRLPGTTNVQIFGAKDYAMRIWMRPDRLAQLKLTFGRGSRSTSRTRSSQQARSVRPLRRQSGPRLHRHSQGPFRDPKVREHHHRSDSEAAAVRLIDVARVEARRGTTTSSDATTKAHRVGAFLQSAPHPNGCGHREDDRARQALPEGLTYAIP